MAERIHSSPERENSVKIEGSREYYERLKEDREKEARVERKGENSNEILKQINEALDEKEKLSSEVNIAPKSTKPLSRKAQERANYKKEMDAIYPSLSLAGRSFSKLIHSKPIEKTSEVLGNTVARPNVILSGSIAAFILTTAVYLWARYANYPLSGFETIASFIVGWLIGIIFDFSRITLTGKN